jgi:hypothetical protein
MRGAARQIKMQARAGRHWLAAVAVACLLAEPMGASAQSWGTEVKPEQQAKPPAAPAQPNTTVITRTPERPAVPQDKGRATNVQLSALLTENGSRIDQGIVWRIYDARRAGNQHKLLATLKEAAPTVRLSPGEYMINAAFGRANLTRKITVKAGEAQAERFVLNAGGLRVQSVLANGEAAPERSTVFDIFSDERDQFGNRTPVMNGVRTGLIVRLNAGIYHIVSTYGDANAIERSDVTVEAGKLTEAVVRHAGAKVTLKLVARAGGEAISDVRWSLLTADGLLVKESLGALPTHILQPGNYMAVAKQGAASFSREFKVEPGETRQVEVLVQ